jgi:transposase-like protein
VSYETIRLWCQKLGAVYVRKLKRRQDRLGDHWHLDEVFLRINGQQQYLWRAIDQDGDVIDILVQPQRERRAAERFFRRLVRGQGREPLRIITDRLRSYSAAMRTSFCHVAHTTERYANNRMEASHQPIASAGTPNVSIQVCPSGPTVSFPPWRGPQSVSTRTSLNQIRELPILAIAILFDVADSDRGLRSIWTTLTALR